VSERQASVHTGGPGRLSRDRDETLHGGTGVVGASAPRFAGRTREVTCARPVMDQHDLSVFPRAGGGPGHDDIGEGS
jgi:hypothetical protein